MWAQHLHEIVITHQAEKNLDLRPYDRQNKVLLLACAANCIVGTILVITLWKGAGEGNAQARLRA